MAMNIKDRPAGKVIKLNPKAKLKTKKKLLNQIFEQDRKVEEILSKTLDTRPPFDPPYAEIKSKDVVAANDAASWQEECPAYYHWLKAFSIQPCKINKKGSRIPPKVTGADSFLVSSLQDEHTHLQRTANSRSIRNDKGREKYEPLALADRWDEYCDHGVEGWNDLRPPSVAQLIADGFSKGALCSAIDRKPKKNITRLRRINALNRRMYFRKLLKMSKLNGHIDCLPIVPVSGHGGIYFFTREPYLSSQLGKAAPIERFMCNQKSHQKWMLFCEYYKAYLSGQIDSVGLVSAGKKIYRREDSLEFFSPHLFPKTSDRVYEDDFIDAVYEVLPNDDVPKMSEKLEKEISSLKQFGKNSMDRVLARKARISETRARIKRDNLFVNNCNPSKGYSFVSTSKPFSLTPTAVKQCTATKVREGANCVDEEISVMVIAKGRKNLPSLLVSPPSIGVLQEKSVAV